MKTFIHRIRIFSIVFIILLIISLPSCYTPSDGRFVVYNVESNKKGKYVYTLFSATGIGFANRYRVYMESDTLYQYGDTLILKLKNNESKIN